MSDLVKTLRRYQCAIVCADDDLKVGPAMCANAFAEAADRIEALEKANAELRSAALQCLDDMGVDGHSICEHAKAQLRLAIGSDYGGDDAPDYTLEAAQVVIDDCDMIYSLARSALQGKGG